MGINVLLQDRINELYFEEHLTPEEICKVTRCPISTIYKALKKKNPSFTLKIKEM